MNFLTMSSTIIIIIIIEIRRTSSMATVSSVQTYNTIILYAMELWASSKIQLHSFPQLLMGKFFKVL